jgi:hypothetical protein
MNATAELLALEHAGRISPETEITWGELRGVAVRICHDDKIVDHGFAGELQEIATSLAILAQIAAFDLLEQPLDAPRTGRTEEALLQAAQAIELVNSLARGVRRYERKLSAIGAL